MSSPYKHEQNPEEDDKMHEYSNSPSAQENDNEEVKVAEQQSQASPQATPEPSATAGSRGTKRQRRSKNSPEPDYSAIVQEQMAATNRTGQACDRCKGRKMKCDSNPTGCANCIATDSVCRQTDPITKVSSIRGEVNQLRRENDDLRQQNEDLKRALNQSNSRVRQYESMAANGQVPFMGGMGHLNQQHPFAQQPRGYTDSGIAAVGTERPNTLPTSFQPTRSHYENIQGSRDFTAALATNNSSSRHRPLAPRPRPTQPTIYNGSQAGPTTQTAPVPNGSASSFASPQQQALGNQFQRGQGYQFVPYTNYRRSGRQQDEQDPDPQEFHPQDRKWSS